MTTLEAKVDLLIRTVATKEDLKGFATKEDLKRFATKEDLTGLERRLGEKIDAVEQKVDAVEQEVREVHGDIKRLGEVVYDKIAKELPQKTKTVKI